MNIAIVGSRNFKNQKAVRAFVRKIAPSHPTVVSGGSRGPDSWAIDEAEKQNLNYIIYPADWKFYGPSGGIRRNILIVNDCELLVAFWDGTSKVTAHCIELAKYQNKLLRVFSEQITEFDFVQKV